MKRLCVFAGSNGGSDGRYAEAARALGEAMAERELDLVYGGGSVGLMGVLADTLLEHERTVIGIIPEALEEREVAHNGLTQLHVVPSMHVRKARMVDLADGFVALPGGLGTLEELCEALTWAQLGIHAKPCGIFDVAGFWDPLLAMLDRATEEGFVRPEHRQMLLVDSAPDGLLDRFLEYRAPTVPKWMDRDQV